MCNEILLRTFCKCQQYFTLISSRCSRSCSRSFTRYFQGLKPKMTSSCVLTAPRITGIRAFLFPRAFLTSLRRTLITNITFSTAAHFVWLYCEEFHNLCVQQRVTQVVLCSLSDVFIDLLNFGAALLSTAFPAGVRTGSVLPVRAEVIRVPVNQSQISIFINDQSQISSERSGALTDQHCYYRHYLSLWQ